MSGLLIDPQTHLQILTLLSRWSDWITREIAIIWENMLSLNILEYNLDRTVSSNISILQNSFRVRVLERWCNPFRILDAIRPYRKKFCLRRENGKIQMEFIYRRSLYISIYKRKQYISRICYISVHKRVKYSSNIGLIIEEEQKNRS